MPIPKSKIQAIVERLLSDNGVTEAPVPLLQIAQACGVRVFADSLKGDLSGFLYRGNNKVVIGVNTLHHPVRQNFTMAHELGHFLLHDREHFHIDHEFRIRLRNNISSQGTDEGEREANHFAAALLMPKKFLENDLKDKEYIDLFAEDFLHDLACKYGVSTQALVYRLKNLGYLVE